MPKNKLIVIVIVIVVAGAGVYKFMLAGSPTADAKPKVDGVVYVLGKEFLVNLADDRYAKFTAALVLKEEPAAAHGESSPPEGYGTMPEEAVVRDAITDVVGSATGAQLTSSAGREKVKKAIEKRLHQTTDVEANDVLFPDIAVQ